MVKQSYNTPVCNSPVAFPSVPMGSKVVSKTVRKSCNESRVPSRAGYKVTGGFILQKSTVDAVNPCKDVRIAKHRVKSKLDLWNTIWTAKMSQRGLKIKKSSSFRKRYD